MKLFSPWMGISLLLLLGACGVPKPNPMNRPNPSASLRYKAKAPPAFKGSASEKWAKKRAAVARAGGRLFARDCSSCHGPDARGTASGPSLVSAGLLHSYPTRPALADFIRRNMPLNRPGTLTAQEAQELAAWLFQKNGHP